MILQPVLVPVRDVAANQCKNVAAAGGSTNVATEGGLKDVAAAPRGDCNAANHRATAGEGANSMQGATGGLSASADVRPSPDAERIIKPRTPAYVALQREAADRALQHCAKLVGAPLDGWEKNADGAPIPNQGFYWSISHKRKWACAVIADHPVGIDIEEIKPRRNKLIFNELASEEEWSLMPDRSWESFFMLWTAKEAVLKANGVGIGRFADCRLVSCDATLTPEGVLHQSPKRKRAGHREFELDPRSQADSQPPSMHLTFLDKPWQVLHFLHQAHVAAVTGVAESVTWIVP